MENEIHLCRTCSKTGNKNPQFIKNKIYKRNCSTCNKNLYYKSYGNWWISNKKHSLCKSCSKKDTNNPLWGKVHTLEHKTKISISQTGKHHTEESKKKISEILKGKSKSEEHKEKLRVCALDRVEKLGRTRGYNPKACQFIDDFGNRCGYNFQHALNGGEVVIIGYCPDGYDKERNIIFEYDEPWHETKNYKLKDLRRAERLIEKLNCNIFRYSEKFNRLYKSTPTYSELFCA
jgi:hypothetical protein